MNLHSVSPHKCVGCTISRELTYAHGAHSISNDSKTICYFRTRYLGKRLTTIGLNDRAFRIQHILDFVFVSLSPAKSSSES